MPKQHRSTKQAGRDQRQPDGPVPTRVPVSGLVFGGVDTHADSHTVAAVSDLGALLGTATFPADPTGYRDLQRWLAGFGTVMAVGVEGTGSYGAALAHHLADGDLEEVVKVVEVNRPNRAARRRGKSDPFDAEAAARAVLAGTATAVPKTHTGVVEAIRVLHTTRRGAVQARTAAINSLHQLIITGPADLRAQLQPLTRKCQVAMCAGFRPGDLTQPLHATKTALRRLARRIQHLNQEIDDAFAELTGLVTQHAPRLLAETGVGPLTAAQLLITAGDNPDRLTSPASFAALCGTTPIPASSGKTSRHRLNRGGDRQANSALHTIAISRLRYDPETQAYAARRQKEGKTDPDIRRCVKRYLARRLCLIISPPETATTLTAA